MNWPCATLAFFDFQELLDAAGGFYPSLNVADPERLELANLYDAAQAARNDPRRALRWTGPFRAPGSTSRG